MAIALRSCLLSESSLNEIVGRLGTGGPGRSAGVDGVYRRGARWRRPIDDDDAGNDGADDAGDSAGTEPDGGDHASPPS
jgi:hypothetical protein